MLQNVMTTLVKQKKIKKYKWQFSIQTSSLVEDFVADFEVAIRDFTSSSHQDMVMVKFSIVSCTWYLNA
ncbi:hypothetical protein O3P69_007408 [Scylla paramamosain]|uniref:Uncharacterized protein n=1 Tax=Scylla paramamosain TaxID=85552 RepID=A0AAW0V3C5_SCYPA